MSHTKKLGIVAGVLLAMVAILSVFLFAPHEAVEESVIQTQTEKVQKDMVPVVDGVTPIYATVIMHNEEPNSGRYPNFVEDEEAFWLHRDAVVEFATRLTKAGGSFHYQSDWTFLLAATMFDNGTPSTNDKNFLRYLKEDLGVMIDPHAHEKTYSYADVVYLIEQLGVESSHTVGGFIGAPAESSKLEYFWRPIQGDVYKGEVWKPEILWGAGTSNHKNEEELWISGIWKPSGNDEFTTHDDRAKLPHVGGFKTDFTGLDVLLKAQEDGELEEGKIWTMNIFEGQTSIVEPGEIDRFIEEFETYKENVDNGDLVWTDMETMVDLWEAAGEQPSQYFWVQ
jgi:hypothetical protein